MKGETVVIRKQKQKYRGMMETQKSRNKTSSGDIGLNIRTLASPKVGQDQVSGGVSVLCWHGKTVFDTKVTKSLITGLSIFPTEFKDVNAVFKN